MSKEAQEPHKPAATYTYDQSIRKMARELSKLGLGAHWLHKGEKAPVASGWQNVAHYSWKRLEATHQEGYGVGLRLGGNSPLPGGGFLAVIDVDIKSPEDRHKKEALRTLKKLFPRKDLLDVVVKTGMGYHVYIKTKAPVDSRKLARSTDRVVMGGKAKDAWQLELMSALRFVVLPPTIHPDTKKPYRLQGHISFTGALELVPYIKKKEISFAVGQIGNEGGNEGGEARASAGPKKLPYDFEFINVDLDEKNLPEDLKIEIEYGTDGDRSSAMLSIAMKVLKRGFTVNEAISILIDPAYGFYDCCVDHTKSKKLERHALWVYWSTIKRGLKKVSPSEVFAPVDEDAIDEQPRLSPEKAEKQAAAIARNGGVKDWELTLDRAPPRKGQEVGAVMPTILNGVIILKNYFGGDCIRYDSFKDTLAVKKALFHTMKPDYDTNLVGDPNSDYMTVTEKELAKTVSAWLGTHHLARVDFKPHNFLPVITRFKDLNYFDSAKERFDRLPPHDGKDRRDIFRRLFGCEEPVTYLQELITCVMVASIQRQHVPGFKFDMMLILQGPKGHGKTKFVTELFGSSFVHQNFPRDFESRNALLEIRGKLVLFFDELEKYLPANGTGSIKSFMTRSEDTVRKMHADEDILLPRRCVVIAGVNDERHLNDAEGDRRFNVVRIKRKPTKAEWDDFLEEIPQLWAQMYHIWKTEYSRGKWIELTKASAAIAEDLRAESTIEGGATYMAFKLKSHILKRIETQAGAAQFEKLELAALFDIEEGGPWSAIKPDKQGYKDGAEALRKIGFEMKRITAGPEKGKNRWHLNVDEWIKNYSEEIEEFKRQKMGPNTNSNKIRVLR